MVISNQGELLNEKLLAEIKEKFFQVDVDHTGRKRLFFENSGGSLRLKAAVEAKFELEQIPDCPDRNNATSKMLQEVKSKGLEDIAQVICGSSNGRVVTELTASQVMYQITRAIIENVPGTNVVTTSIEHPSAYDSAQFYAEQTGKEFRVAKANPMTGGVDVEEILKYIDENTCLLSIIGASNVSGTILDLEEITKQAREIKPDLYIISDAVQHIPHGVIDMDALQLDAVNFAPYKGFGIRGCGFGVISERVARLPHHKLLAKPEDEWELGSFPHANFAAISSVVDYVCWVGSQYTEDTDRRSLYVEGMNRIHLHERALLHRLLVGTEENPGLRTIPGISVYLDSEDLTKRDLIVAMNIDGMELADAVAEYYKRGVTVFERVNTSIYSKRIIETLGLTGAIRVSPIHVHSFKDIDEFLQITHQILQDCVALRA